MKISFQKISSALLVRQFVKKYPNVRLLTSLLVGEPKGFYSQEGQDSFIYSHFFECINNHSIPATFLDIGCNQPILFSNSYFFEKHLNYRCIAIDPIMKYAQDWQRLRPKAKLVSVAVGAERGKMELTSFENETDSVGASHPSDMFSTLKPTTKKSKGAQGTRLEIDIYPTQQVIDESQIAEIGIMSIDVEGFEAEVLRGIDFSRTMIHLAVIENNSNSKIGSDKIRQMMKEANFELYARIWGFDDIYVNRASPAWKG